MIRFHGIFQKKKYTEELMLLDIHILEEVLILEYSNVIRRRTIGNSSSHHNSTMMDSSLDLVITLEYSSATSY